MPGPLPGRRVPVTRQLSLFGADSNEAVPGDLEGLLAGPGEVVRMGGAARISVVVADLWRAEALVAELHVRGLDATCVPTIAEQIGVRTGFSTALAVLGDAWMRGAVKRPPRGFFLDGRRLRLWFIAAGRIVPLGVTLGLGPSDEPAWPGVGSALAGAGIPAALVGPRGGGPAYRIVGRRRLFRLIELLGERPSPVPAQAWPDQ